MRYNKYNVNTIFFPGCHWIVCTPPRYLNTTLGTTTLKENFQLIIYLIKSCGQLPIIICITFPNKASGFVDITVFFLFIDCVTKERRSGCGDCVGQAVWSLFEGTHPTIWTPLTNSSKPDYLPKTPCPNTTTLWARISAHGFRGHTIQSLVCAQPSPLKASLSLFVLYSLGLGSMREPLSSSNFHTSSTLHSHSIHFNFVCTFLNSFNNV